MSGQQAQRRQRATQAELLWLYLLLLLLWLLLWFWLLRRSGDLLQEEEKGQACEEAEGRPLERQTAK